MKNKNKNQKIKNYINKIRFKQIHHNKNCKHKKLKKIIFRYR